MATILFFGKLADVSGYVETQHRGGVILSRLIYDLSRDNPDLGQALRDRTTRAALNLNLVPIGDDPIISPGDELAFMPPVSGG
jgi:molybdopterin converting factor small subunit